MFIYLFVFLLSTIFLFLYGKTTSSAKKKMFLIFAILFPSLLAGFRQAGIGTDTNNYVRIVYDLCLRGKTMPYIANHTGIEYLYILINMLVVKTIPSVNIVYFILQFIIQYFILKACVYYEKDCPPWISYLLFLLLFYNRSLNMIRQTISISIILYSFCFYKTDNKKSLLLILLAFLFHNTAIIGFILFIMYKIISLFKGKYTNLVKIFILFLVVMFVIFYKEIISFLINSNILSQRYLFYIKDNSSNVIGVEHVMVILITLLCFISGKVISKTKLKDIPFVIYMGFILYNLGKISNYAQRFSYYYLYFSIFTIPQFPKIFVGKKYQNIFLFILLILALCFWIYYYCILKADRTVPYMSIFSWK